MRLDDLTSVEFVELMKKDPVVILPIGGTEAHGPHLPLSADSLQPEAVAEAVAEKIDGLVAPPLRYAYHSSTRNMPGTLTLSFETTVNAVYDILTSLIENGVYKLVVISGHAGSSHMAALRLACVDVVRDHPEVKLMLLTDYDLAKRYPVDQKGDGHGGMVETSRIMDIAPLLVKAPLKVGRYVDPGFLIMSNPEVSYPDGFVGDTTKSSAALGRQINSFIIDELTRLIRESFGV